MINYVRAVLAWCVTFMWSVISFNNVNSFTLCINLEHMLLGIGHIIWSLFKSFFFIKPKREPWLYKSHDRRVAPFLSKRLDAYSQSRPVHDGAHYLTDVNCC